VRYRRAESERIYQAGCEGDHLSRKKSPPTINQKSKRKIYRSHPMVA
jgi:hypothetical protein